MVNKSIYKRFGYLWVTLILFLISIVGHWVAGWFAFVSEQSAHNQTIVFNEYMVEMIRDTLENWQSEFLQLIWQVAGLTYLWYIGSPQSKEGDDRKEEKLDAILEHLIGKEGKKMIVALDKKYPRV